MLWLCLHPTRLSLAALMPPPGRTLAVTERRGSRRWVLACTDECVAPGTDLAQVQALHPGIEAHPRERRPETEMLRHLAYWAYRFGQPVSLEIREANWDYGLPLPAVWVEIGASLRLFGGLDGLLTQLDLDRAGSWATPLERGVALTPEAALLAALGGDGTVLKNATDQRCWLDALPLARLPLTPDRIAALRGSGFERLGELLALPSEVLARRFDAGLVDYLSRLSGRWPDPRRAVQPPPVYRRRFELFGEITHTEGLQFPLRRLLAELQHYLRARDTGVQQLSLRLSHPRRPDSVLELQLAASTRDAGQLGLLLRERLQRFKLEAPVRGLELVAEHFAAPEVAQFDLFDGRQQQAQAWRETVEKLIARLGTEAVWSLGLVADPRPEKSWRALPPQAEAGPTVTMPPRHLARPTWLLDPPRPLSRPPAGLGPAERIESGWWDGDDVSRDYYVAEAAPGLRLWVYRDRANAAWFLQGLWA